MKFALFLAALLALATGCGTTTGLSPEVGRSGFDNARTVDIRPHGNAPNGMEMVLTGLGAQWNGAQPDKVVLIVAVFNLTTAITGAELNIDGEKMTLTPLPNATDMGAGGDIMKTSTRAFGASLETVEKIVNSKRTWLRVHTPTGHLENAVIDGSKDSKAYNALKRFMAQVKG
jgi:hypothetical protein